jgi:hypothetical protein
MSPHYRQRAARTALAALFAVAPLLLAEPALAEPADSGSEVVFAGGGLLGLTCAAAPSVRTVTVPAESTLRVVNRTGRPADLLLDGDKYGRVPDDTATQVLFRRGPVTLALAPDCVHAEESNTVLVQVDEAPAPTTPPLPAPSTPPPAASPAEPTPAPPGVVGSAPLPPRGQPQVLGQWLPDAGGVARPRQRAANAGAAMPPGGAGRARPRRSSWGTGNPAAAVAGMPPGDRAVPVSGFPMVDVAPPAVGPPVPAAAAEPVAELAPLPGDRSVGLLALVATVCLAGAAAGAIRAIVAQRAYRSVMP